MNEYERHIRTCRLKGCLGRGYYQPWFYFSADGENYRVLKLKRFLFCEEHMKSLGPNDFLSGDVQLAGKNMWGHIESAFAKAGRPVPLKELTLMEWRDA